LSSQGSSNSLDPNAYIQHVLELPSIVISAAYQRKRKQPVIDWSNSQLLTAEENVAALEQPAKQKERSTHAREIRQLEKQKMKSEIQTEKAQHAQQKQERPQAKEARHLYMEYWKDVAAKGWGDDLQRLMKSKQLPLLRAYTGMFCGQVPQVCIRNQRLHCLKRKLRKEGRDPNIVAASTPPPWAHQPRNQSGFNNVDSQPQSEPPRWWAG
jgi:hypothetical protein